VGPFADRRRRRRAVDAALVRHDVVRIEAAAEAARRPR
jgi:hypothetical protein